MSSSSFLGTPTDRWPLTQAVDSLLDSVRVAAVPGFIWIAGACYPGLNVNVTLVRAVLGIAEDYTDVDLPGAGESGAILSLFGPEFITDLIADNSLKVTLFWALCLLPLLLVLARVVVGLAKVSDPRLWEARGDRPAYVVENLGVRRADPNRRRATRLLTAWRAGKRLGLVGLGMWGMLVGLLLGAGLLLIAPAVVLLQAAEMAEASPLFAGLLIPPLLLLLAYAVVLMVVNQLAMHSLAHNRRGVSSALTHAWRLVRSSPMSVFRATVVDFVLAISILAIDSTLMGFFDTLGVPQSLSWIVLFLLYGFAGVTRAGFWARAYRALGGLSAADHVPGL